MLIDKNLLPRIVKEAHSKVPVSDWKNKILHRDDDLPAIVYHNGSMEWFQNGLRHRDNDLPAVILKKQKKQKWFKKGLLHRDNDLPAIVEKNRQRWFKNGLRHRDKGPAHIVYQNNMWYWKNRLHRFDGPCIEYPFLSCKDKKSWFFPDSLFPWIDTKGYKHLAWYNHEIEQKIAYYYAINQLIHRKILELYDQDFIFNFNDLSSLIVSDFLEEKGDLNLANQLRNLYDYFHNNDLNYKQTRSFDASVYVDNTYQ